MASFPNSSKKLSYKEFFNFIMFSRSLKQRSHNIIYYRQGMLGLYRMTVRWINSSWCYTQYWQSRRPAKCKFLELLIHIQNMILYTLLIIRKESTRFCEVCAKYCNSFIWGQGIEIAIPTKWKVINTDTSVLSRSLFYDHFIISYSVASNVKMDDSWLNEMGLDGSSSGPVEPPSRH